MKTANLGADKFKSLIRIISILKDICNDCDIRGGILRERINTLLCLFEMDLSPLIGDLDLPIIDIKQKIDILKIFSDCDVQILTDDKSYIVSDESSQLKFLIPYLEFMDNPFIRDEEFNNLFTLIPEDLILDVQLSKVITKRIKVITPNFNVNNVKIIFSGNMASIVATHQNKEQEAVLLDSIPTSKEMTGITYIVTTPFIFDHDDDVSLKIYEVQEGTCASKFSSKIGDVKINAYTKSLLQDDEL
jgi:hypothetical protein